VAGEFSLYTQLKMQDGTIDGYIKPLFQGIHVYDRRQDSEKAVFQQIYEALVGGGSGLLENRGDQVVTRGTIKGRADAPHVSTWEVILNLIRNAFFKAILPGFDQAVRAQSGGGAPPKE